MNEHNERLTKRAEARRLRVVGMKDKQRLSFDTIGEKLGISRQRAHQLYKKANGGKNVAGR